jgi:hypothetical protein
MVPIKWSDRSQNNSVFIQPEGRQQNIVPGGAPPTMCSVKFFLGNINVGGTYVRMNMTTVMTKPLSADVMEHVGDSLESVKKSINQSSPAVPVS